MMSHLPVLLLKSNADTVFPQRSEAIFYTFVYTYIGSPCLLLPFMFLGMFREV